MKKSIFFIFIYILFTIGFGIYSGNKKYLIINKDYIFDISNVNDIKVVKKYPSYINNSKIFYYDNYGKEDGYIQFVDNKLGINQKNGSNVNIYSNNFKKIDSYNFIASTKNTKIKLLDKDIFKDNNITDFDLNIINENLDIDENANIEKYMFDINSDSEIDYIYTVNNLISSSLLIDNNDETYCHVLVYSNDNVYTLYSKEGPTSKIYHLNNVIDINDDGIYEFNFSVSSPSNEYDSCQSIFKYNDSKYKEIKNCVLGDDENE